MLSSETALSPWLPLNGQRVRRIPSLEFRADDRRDGTLIKSCTVNVGTLRGKSREVVDMLARIGADICCLQETRYKNQGCDVFGKNEEKYKFWYTGNQEGTGGAGIMIKQSMAEDVIKITRHGDRMIRAKLILGCTVWHVFSVYAPQVGRPALEKQTFWDLFEEGCGRIPERDCIIVGGDVNAHIGRDIAGYE